jgi:hypothetical protein
MEGYGRFLKSSVPPPQDWQLDQAREALRCFQKGTENWHIAAPDAQGRVEVGFRVKTRTAEKQVHSSEFQVSSSPRQTGSTAESWLEKSPRTMKVRRFALRVRRLRTLSNESSAREGNLRGQARPSGVAGGGLGVLITQPLLRGRQLGNAAPQSLLSVRWLWHAASQS